MNFLVVFLIFTIQSMCSADVINDNDVYTLEHSIDDSDFKEIGNINLRVVKQNQNTAQLQSLNAQGEIQNIQQTKNTIYSTKIESNDFDEQTKKLIQKSSSNAMYRLRLCKKPTCYASTFTFLNNLINSGFRVNLTIHTNNNNHPNSITIKTSPLENQKSAAGKKEFESLSIWANIQTAKPAQQPDTETYLEKVKKEVEHKEKGEQADNQSFLSKYWIYIVPFVVVMFLMNIVNPEGAVPS